MQVPSGAEYSYGDLEILREMANVGFVKHSDSPFVLKLGIESHVYVFGREDLTDNPHLEVMVGEKIADVVNETRRSDGRQPCLIGIPTAGTPLAQAASMMDVTKRGTLRVRGRQPICHRIMRETLKQHGAHRSWINGNPNTELHVYWWVDNVATDGTSKFEAADKAKEQGYPERLPVLIWIDRQQGAVERLHRGGFKQVFVVYQLLDVTFAFGELGLWPKSAVKAVEEEIKAHQLLTHN